jgi:hypothetical protein
MGTWQATATTARAAELLFRTAGMPARSAPERQPVLDA